MVDKLALLIPEIILFIGTCIVMVVGLSPSAGARNQCWLITAVSLLFAGIAAGLGPEPAGALLPGMTSFGKGLTAVVGIMLVLMMPGTVDRREEEKIRLGGKFDPLRLTRAEFYAFILFSLTGLMLTASADTLIWLFLALELTSLPTYVMVTISSRRDKAQEAGVKYFFLGALGAATFLYGFAMLYGGTGTVRLDEIRQVIAEGGMNNLTVLGLVLSLVGIFFKIAAVPMHFYTADVYQGAASSVTAFLAFVPKTAGFLAILLLCAAAGWDQIGPAGDATALAEPLRYLIGITAAVTMTIGNVLAWKQRSVKRMLAYSSIAHSGYMLVGVLAGPGNGTIWSSGIAAVLFYLAVYGIGNAGAFAALASIEKIGKDGEAEEVDDIDDLKGLHRSNPVAAWVMALSAASLLGIPPLLGFFGKLPLFAAGVRAGEIPLIVILGLNSAIAAFYYLRLIKAPLLDDPATDDSQASASPFAVRLFAGVVSAGGVVVVAIASGALMSAATTAGQLNDSSAPPAEATQERGSDHGEDHADSGEIESIERVASR
ncbi:MAG: NADH-quinone oxidoreductase subunit N [Planctomycetota bacterium]